MKNVGLIIFAYRVNCPNVGLICFIILIDPKNFEHLANVHIKNLKYVCCERICSVDKNIIKALPKLIDFRYPFMMLKFS